MNFTFHPEAEIEFFESITFYEESRPGLGLDFAREIEYTIQNILEFPNLWPFIDDEIRRCLVHRFPYGILYSIEPEGIYILAVMPLRRDPDYWKSRIE